MGKDNYPKRVSLDDIFLSQRIMSEEFEALCVRPIASSQEEVKSWLANNEEYLRAKAKNVAPLPLELESKVDTIFEQNRDLYYFFVEDWYDNRQSYLANEEIDFHKVERDKKIQDFFDIFESVIDAIINHKNWFDLYKCANIKYGTMVWNIASLDLFAWQLPSADFRHKNNYLELAKIMTIFFFFEKLYKNESQLSNNTNPIDEIFNLDKIISYYYFAKNIGAPK